MGLETVFTTSITMETLFTLETFFTSEKCFYSDRKIFYHSGNIFHLWILDGPRKLGQPRSTRGANGSLMEKHFTTLETDFTLETLLPWRKGTFDVFSFY